jgi:hypothetical protein
MAIIGGFEFTTICSLSFLIGFVYLYWPLSGFVSVFTGGVVLLKLKVSVYRPILCLPFEKRSYRLVRRYSNRYF